MTEERRINITHMRYNLCNILFSRRAPARLVNPYLHCGKTKSQTQSILANFKEG